MKQAGLTWLHLSVLATTPSLDVHGINWCTHWHTKQLPVPCVACPPLVTRNQGQPLGSGSSHHLFGLVDIWPEPTLKYHYRGGGWRGTYFCILYQDDIDILHLNWTCKISAKKDMWWCIFNQCVGLKWRALYSIMASLIVLHIKCPLHPESDPDCSCCTFNQTKRLYRDIIQSTATGIWRQALHYTLLGDVLPASRRGQQASKLSAS